MFCSQDLQAILDDFLQSEYRVFVMGRGSLLTLKSGHRVKYFNFRRIKNFMAFELILLSPQMVTFS
jgi:hypothetical protein